MAKDTKAAVKAEAPKRTGALKFAVNFRIIGRKGWSAAVVGVKSKYVRMVKGKEKLPNLYALKVGMKTIIAKYVNRQAVDRLKDAVALVLEKLLQGKK